MKKNKSARKLASFDLLEGGSITLIKDYPCKTRRELQKEEGKLIRENRQDITNYFIGDVSSHDFWKAYGIIRKMGEL